MSHGAKASGLRPAVFVLFEDEHLLAVSKPAGIVSHPCYKHADGTLFDALVDYLRGGSEGSPQGSGAAPVHPRLLQRLDKWTSGVVLVSKTMRAHAGVVRAMTKGAAGGVRKDYLAVVHGVPDPGEGEIRLRLRRDPADTRRVAASEGEGKASVTRFRVLHALRLAAGARASLLLCSPLTGRMHQIRVHLATIGCPIVGDAIYGLETPEDVAFGRQALHAWRVSLAHPVTGAALVITAPLPADIASLIDLPIPVGLAAALASSVGQASVLAR